MALRVLAMLVPMRKSTKRRRNPRPPSTPRKSTKRQRHKNHRQRIASVPQNKKIANLEAIARIFG